MNGLFVLVTFVPIIGGFFQLFLLLAPDDSGDNRFGSAFGGQPQRSLAENRDHISQIRAEAARAYAEKNAS